MSADIADFSCQIKDRLAVRVGAQRFKIWFKNATRFTLSEGFLRVGVPNHFIGGWIERHFNDAILDVARELAGRDVQIAFVLDPQLSGGMGKTQLNSQAASVARTPQRALRGPEADAPESSERPRLRGRFDAFVTGPSNRMAFNAAMDVAAQRPAAASPLFLHGGCGLGKTHLLHAIANALEDGAAAGREVRWVYVAGEEFTNQFLYALKSRQLESFRKRYRTVDVLLLDDVHFLANKKATQDEFLHTFNAIDTVGKRIVLASDAAPQMIGQMSEALINRFMAGMVVRIDLPDHATRCDILRRRAAAMGATNGRAVPQDVIDYVADRIRSNVRELEGALLRILAFAGITESPLTLPLARQALERHASRSEPLVTAEQIEAAVATYFGLTAADLHTSRKARTIALARALSMYLARKYTHLSFPELGRLMGNKNHATVLLACRRIEQLLQADAEVQWQSAAGPQKGKLGPMLRALEAPLSA